MRLGFVGSQSSSSFPPQRLNAWLTLKTCAASTLFLLAVEYRLDARLLAINHRTLRLSKMNEQQYKAWWQLYRRVAVGEQLSDEEQRIYQSGLAELEAEEMAALRPADDECRRCARSGASWQRSVRNWRARRRRYARAGIGKPISGVDQ
jgi:hypothetical protein